MQLELGCKIFMHYGPNVLIVGHVIDHSPDYQLIGVSMVPYDIYNKMTGEQKASCPINSKPVIICVINHMILLKS